MTRTKRWFGVANSDIGTKGLMDVARDLINDSVSISLKVYQNIIEDFMECESGAILGIRKNENIVSAYYYDKIGSDLSKSNEYIPHIISLERVISSWFKHNIYFCGILHSHPVGYEKLSQSDISYAVNFCALNGAKFLRMFLFVIQTR